MPKTHSLHTSRSCLCLLATAMLALTTALGAETKSQETLCIMSYNLRFASTKGPNAWPDRRPLMAECIRRVNPDVFGTQEGVYPQLQDIAVDQPGYDWIGLGRDGGSKGEFMAVFYRKARLQPLAFDHFWLSDTPEVMASMTWGTAHRRMVTWVQFQDRVTGKKFYLVNTHLDHQVQPARERGAALIRDRVSKLDDSIPVILTGDFNCDTNNTAYKTLTADGFFKDTWYTAKERKGEGLGTFNGFKEIPKNDVRIDWILTRGGVEASSTEIVTFTKDGQFPSDHFPLVTWLRLVD